MKRCRHAAEGVVDKAADKIKHFPFGPVGDAFAASDAEGSASFVKWKKDDMKCHRSWALHRWRTRARLNEVAQPGGLYFYR
jgi:hypothetical protein